jgi:hypothetical protein
MSVERGIGQGSYCHGMVLHTVAKGDLFVQSAIAVSDTRLICQCTKSCTVLMKSQI